MYSKFEFITFKRHLFVLESDVRFVNKHSHTHSPGKQPKLTFSCKSSFLFYFFQLEPLIFHPAHLFFNGSVQSVEERNKTQLQADAKYSLNFYSDSQTYYTVLSVLEPCFLVFSVSVTEWFCKKA